MEPVSALSIFPEEVWGNVFEHLEAKDAVNCRLVSSAWTKELDQNFDKWVVRLDENSPDDLQHLLQLKVEQATILDLSTPVDGGQDGTHVLFKYPELLKKLSIHEDGRICPENLLLLLQSCNENIKYLNLSMFGCDDEFLVHPSYNIQPNRLDFGNLETLKLDSIYNLKSPPSLEHTVLNVILGLSAMRKVKQLELFISGVCFNAVSSTLLAFIAKNGRNLEALNCCIVQIWETEEPPRPPTSIQDVPALREVLGLKNIAISYGRLCWGRNGGANLDPELITGWSALLEVQMNLMHLDLENLPISRQILQDVYHNNENTLRKLRLERLMFNFDLAILAHCIHLKELEITACSKHILRNAGSLPLGIQKFSSSNYLI